MPTTASKPVSRHASVVRDRKNRGVSLSIKAKDSADQQQAMSDLNQASGRDHAGTTSLGALLRAKLDNSNN